MYTDRVMYFSVEGECHPCRESAPGRAEYSESAMIKEATLCVSHNRPTIAVKGQQF